MGNDVFANGREISCKAADGKSICAFPDVCFTPPQSPATPPGVPVPYPNTGFAKDTTSGSKTVKITGKEVMLKNKSYFKTSFGDEPGCAPKKGIVTSKIKGKIYFTSWSTNVKFEGENIVRHLDFTTHNHGSANANAAKPHPHLDSSAIASPPECDDLDKTLQATLEEELPRSKKNTRAKKRKDGTIQEYDATVAVGFASGDIVAGASSIGRSVVQAAKDKGWGYKYAGYSGGIQRGEKSKVKTCSGKNFVYIDDPAHPKQGHAEAKIIEDWFKSGAKGRLLLNPSKTPCPDCSRLINEVNKSGEKNCDKIILCESSISRS